MGLEQVHRKPPWSSEHHLALFPDFPSFTRLGATSSMKLPAAVSFFLLLVASCNSFYLPGVTPVEYQKGSLVRIKVNSLTSTKTAIPYDFYSLPFCLPFGKNPKAQVCFLPSLLAFSEKVENFGEILWGDSIKPSLYVAHLGVNVTCRRVCQRQFYTKGEQCPPPPPFSACHMSTFSFAFLSVRLPLFA